MDRCFVELSRGSRVVEPLHDVVLPLHVQNGNEKRPYCGIGNLLTVDIDYLALLFSHMYLSGKRLFHSELEHASSAPSTMNNGEDVS